MANPQLSKSLQLHSLWVASCGAEGVRLDLAGENLRNTQFPKVVEPAADRLPVHDALLKSASR